MKKSYQKSYHAPPNPRAARRLPPQRGKHISAQGQRRRSATLGLRPQNKNPLASVAEERGEGGEKAEHLLPAGQQIPIARPVQYGEQPVNNFSRKVCRGDRFCPPAPLRLFAQYENKSKPCTSRTTRIKSSAPSARPAPECVHPQVRPHKDGRVVVELALLGTVSHPRIYPRPSPFAQAGPQAHPRRILRTGRQHGSPPQKPERALPSRTTPTQAPRRLTGALHPQRLIPAHS